jgi:hypothetical protein
MGKEETIFKVIFGKVVGFLIFIILVVVAEMVLQNVENETFSQIVQFFSSNALLLFLITIFAMMGGIFWVLDFPFNIPSPIVQAVGSIFIVTFLLKAVAFTAEMFGKVFEVSGIIQIIIFILVGLVILVMGYLKLLVKLGKDIEPLVAKETRRIRSVERKQRKKRRYPSLKEVRGQFKLALFAMLRNARVGLIQEREE